MEPESSREVFRGKLIRVEVERWPAGQREVVRHPGACAVVALTQKGEVLLVRQMREPVREALLEIPAGIYDVEGEDPASCAARELLEETGFRLRDLEPLGSIYTSPGFTDERIDLFVGRAEESGSPGEEGLEVVRMPFADALAAVSDGRIPDAKTVSALLKARSRQEGT
ncbi:MAG TPA: NUDIX hydrolase [Actinomycetota bacterium]|nr:NUDIX hydrolase [Actinomycetota bacterium]